MQGTGVGSDGTDAGHQCWEVWQRCGVQVEGWKGCCNNQPITLGWTTLVALSTATKVRSCLSFTKPPPWPEANSCYPWNSCHPCAGYDVWLTSARGTTYSRNHTSLKIDTPEYWAFSFDEMAKWVDKVHWACMLTVKGRQVVGIVA